MMGNVSRMKDHLKQCNSVDKPDLYDGILCIFSTFDFVHSKIHNRLGTTKAGKLVFLYKPDRSELWHG